MSAAWAVLGWVALLFGVLFLGAGVVNRRSKYRYEPEMPIALGLLLLGMALFSSIQAGAWR